MFSPISKSQQTHKKRPKKEKLEFWADTSALRIIKCAIALPSRTIDAIEYEYKISSLSCSNFQLFSDLNLQTRIVFTEYNTTTL